MPRRNHRRSRPSSTVAPPQPAVRRKSPPERQPNWSPRPIFCDGCGEVMEQGTRARLAFGLEADSGYLYGHDSCVLALMCLHGIEAWVA